MIIRVLGFELHVLVIKVFPVATDGWKIDFLFWSENFLLRWIFIKEKYEDTFILRNMEYKWYHCQQLKYTYKNTKHINRTQIEEKSSIGSAMMKVDWTLWGIFCTIGNTIKHEKSYHNINMLLGRFVVYNLRIIYFSEINRTPVKCDGRWLDFLKTGVQTIWLVNTYKSYFS